MTWGGESIFDLINFKRILLNSSNIEAKKLLHSVIPSEKPEGFEVEESACIVAAL